MSDRTVQECPRALEEAIVVQIQLKTKVTRLMNASRALLTRMAIHDGCSRYGVRDYEAMEEIEAALKELGGR